MVSMVAAGPWPVGRSQQSFYAPTQHKTVRHSSSEEVSDVFSTPDTKIRKIADAKKEVDESEAKMSISRDTDGDVDRVTFPPNTKRVMLELCTSHDSEMGKEVAKKSIRMERLPS